MFAIRHLGLLIYFSLHYIIRETDEKVASFPKKFNKMVYVSVLITINQESSQRRAVIKQTRLSTFLHTIQIVIAIIL